MNAVAVVGLGAMGSRLAARLLDAGHAVTVWNRSPAAAAALSGLGATVAATPAEAAAVAALGEALALGRALGLRPDVLADVLAVTPLAGRAARRRPAIDADDYPRRFALSLARKDADLIGQAARSAGAELRLAEAARGWLADAEAAGWGEHDYTAVLAAILGRQRPGDRACGGSARRRRRYDGLILDLDGVVWLGSQPIGGAAEAIARLRGHGTRVVFLTNDPGESRSRQAARLAAAGIPATAEQVITSGYAMARYLASRSDLDGRPALVCGPPALRKEIARAGIRPVSRDRAGQAGMVIVAGHEGFGYAELRAAIRAIADGAALFATGRDPVVPSGDGPLPATGAVLAAVEVASGVSATVIGKPHPFIFGIARDALAGCEHIAMVGDNLAADIAGARRAGLEAILVLTGATAEQDLGRSPVQPDRVLPSLAALGTELEGD
jgi:glycerol-1-phosphatase